MDIHVTRADHPGSKEQRLALAQLRRAARRVSKDDWATLFRQMRHAVSQIATHPFLKGDAEAEKRLMLMLTAIDLEEMDHAFDHLAEYVDGKVAAVMIRRGEEPPQPKAKHTGVNGRAMGQMGPSGDDFMTDSTDAPVRKRDVIRL